MARRRRHGFRRRGTTTWAPGGVHGQWQRPGSTTTWQPGAHGEWQQGVTSFPRPGAQRGVGQVPAPPPGTYDPSLDAQLDAARRGYGDFRRDTELANTRATQDYGFGREDINRDAGRGMEDITNRGTDLFGDYTRSMGEILRDRARAAEDYTGSRTRLGENRDRALDVLGRNYRFLGNQQGQSARAAGVASGGALAQSAQKRAANQAFETVPITTEYGRGMSDLERDYGRFGADSQTAATNLAESATRAKRDLGLAGSRLQEDRSTGLGRLGVGYERGVTDRATGLSRAGRENRAFGQDIGAARFYQARASIGRLPRYRPRQGFQEADPYSRLNRDRLPRWRRRGRGA